MEDKNLGVNVRVKRRNWIYLFRQVLVCSGVWTMFFLVGQMLGAPTVFVPQIHKANPPGYLSDEMSSWLYSAFGFAVAPWLFVQTTLMKAFGPRVPHVIACIGALIANSIFYFSTTPTQILISQITMAMSQGTCLTVGVIIVTEYSSPEYRGIFLTIKSASLSWGMWSANAIGTFFHWKCIAYAGFVCCAYLFTFIFWPESPQWLASKGRFEQCRTAYHWLHGNDEKSVKELDILISSQTKEENVKVDTAWSVNEVLGTIKSKKFYGPVLLSALLVCQYNLTGKFICMVYSIDILKKMTASESAAYIGMLILDGVTVFSMYVGCYLSKILTRRCLYLTSSSIGIVFLFIMSLYSYLVKLAVILENELISIVLLVGFSITMGCGPMIMSTSIFAELIPMRFKCTMVVVISFIFFIMLSTMIKVAPLTFKTLGMHGTFLFYGVTSGTCTWLLYKYMPETKDKTLQEIEEHFKDKDVGPETERLNPDNAQI